MDIRSLKLAYFSPTGTTAAIVEAIAEGLGYDVAEDADITMPQARQEPLHASADELLVVAVPVYGGRIPLLLEPWLRSLQLDGTPVVCVVVFGNRAFEDALIELADIVTGQGGVVLGGAAFIGEHSFSSDKYPVAVARPDADDLRGAEDFGRKVRQALDALADIDEAPKPAIPGDRPYKERTPRGPVDFISVGEECVLCGVCAEQCPVGAIDEADFKSTDPEKCIMCCACIKVCPEHARSAKSGSPVEGFAKWLNGNCAERKEPAYFL
ncbi:Ferredoxin [Pseudodesulfovibrio hydrargyri]|uniref:Ferredoxin n=1 Tax=Pseudodesulfovibrio hydrargyri TaxID=2125990 RepID=A0A1J5MZC7_9BACT|nr:4Fe-4S binding protein [Pseudodesulfovibrio hydrargyri]OIQ51893.1 Ferredoxin [Pseudodesulfovibrio hydrargyri]